MRPILPLLLILSAAQPTSAQNWPGPSVRRVSGGIEVLDSPSGVPRRVYFDSTERWITDLSVGPGGGRVAFVRFTRVQTGPEDYSDRRESEVVVLDAQSGRRQLGVEGGLSYVWCGADCVAVLYGTYNENSEGGPYGDSLDVFHASTGRRIHSFHPKDTSFIAPRWVASDSVILAEAYARGGYQALRLPGLRLDLRTGSLQAESVIAGSRSGSGRFVHNYEMDESWVQRASSDTSRVRPPLEGRWQAEEWLGRSDKMLLIKLAPRVTRPRVRGDGGGVRPVVPRPAGTLPPERTYRIWDVATGQVSDEWKAAETPWRGPAPNGCRLFLKDGRLTAAPGCR